MDSLVKCVKTGLIFGRVFLPAARVGPSLVPMQPLPSEYQVLIPRIYSSRSVKVTHSYLPSRWRIY